MKVYSVYMSGNTSEDAVEVFTSEEEMNRYVAKDIEEVCEILKDDGYTPVIERYSGMTEVYADGITYNWCFFQSTLHEKGGDER